ncbi:MAG: FHA domain-containing protein [Proteobacteria bacterium]|nr:FHA domain-containing protein [Pseudomonadota bacterium]
MKVLLKVKSPKKELFFEASKVEATIGRGDRAKVKVDDDNCSRVHCKIYLNNNALWVEDMGSKNGTFINGLNKAKSQLFTNDKILIGDTEIIVCSDKNSSEVLSLLKFSGSSDDRAKASLEIEDQEALTQVRVNPMSALKTPSKSSGQSKMQLDNDPMFKDSRTTVPEFRTINKKAKPEKIASKWQYNLASLIDLSIFIFALGLPPYFFWFGKASRSRVSGLGQGLDMKQIGIVGGLSLACVIAVWVINSKSRRGTMGERLLGIRKPKDD